MTMVVINLRGKRFGRLTALNLAPFTGRRTRWVAQCDCGNVIVTLQQHLRNGSTKSCGCLHRPHGLSETPTYQIWCAMRKRCANPNSGDYINYGGRGITVCERWNSFPAFLEDMGERPDGMSIERVDNDGNYEPGNCRWATRAEQNQNTRTNHRITINGVTRHLQEWSRMSGTHIATILSRLERNWTPERAVYAPPMSRSERQELSAIARRH